MLSICHYSYLSQQNFSTLLKTYILTLTISIFVSPYTLFQSFFICRFLRIFPVMRMVILTIDRSYLLRVFDSSDYYSRCQNKQMSIQFDLTTNFTQELFPFLALVRKIHCPASRFFTFNLICVSEFKV